MDNIGRMEVRVLRWVSILLLLVATTGATPPESTYWQVIKTLEHLTPTGSMEVNMGVEKNRYQETFTLSEAALANLQTVLPKALYTRLEPLKNRDYSSEKAFLDDMEQQVGAEQTIQYGSLIAKYLDYQAIPAYNINDQFELWFQSNQDCYLAIMHIAVGTSDQAGDITFILPNQKFPEIKIEGGRVYSTMQNFQLAMTAGPPGGFETLNLFCSRNKIDFFAAAAVDAQHQNYTIPAYNEERLHKLLTTLTSLERTEWAGKSLPVLIRGTRAAGVFPPIGALGTTGVWFPPIDSAGTTGRYDAPKVRAIGLLSYHTQVMEQLEKLTPKKTIEVKIGTERGQYEIGDMFELRFQVSKACYPVLMDISANALSPEERYITFLIPSREVANEPLEAGRIYSTLHDFGMPIRIGPPYGIETINLFCSPEPLNLFPTDILRTKRYYMIAPDDNEQLRLLLERLQALERTEWSGNSVSFRIGGRPRSGFEKPYTQGTIFSTVFPPIGTWGTTGEQ